MSPVEVAGGFPYLQVDLGGGIAHVIPLPATCNPNALQRVALAEVLEWRRPFALVFGPADALLFDANGGSLRTDKPPDAPFALAGRLRSG
jgi:hypothetical protein